MTDPPEKPTDPGQASDAEREVVLSRMKAEEKKIEAEEDSPPAHMLDVSGWLKKLRGRKS